jgi:hypothetical protein
VNETVPPVIKVICSKGHNKRTVLTIVARGIFVPPVLTQVFRMEGTAAFVDHMPKELDHYYYVNTPETPEPLALELVCWIKCSKCFIANGHLPKDVLKLNSKNMHKIYEENRRAGITSLDLAVLAAKIRGK